MTKSIACAVGLFAVVAVASIASAQVGNPLDAGLVLRYDFEGDFLDNSGNDRTPTQKDVTLTADRFGRAASACSFNGTSSYLSMASVPEPTDNAYTWAAWIRTDSLTAVAGLEGVQLIERCDRFGFNSLNPRFFLKFDGGIGFVSCCPNNELYSSAGGIAVGKWRHVAITSEQIANGNSATRRLYINGQIAGTDTVSQYGATGFKLLLIGADRLYNQNFFHGAMDDVRIYNRELTASEVNQLYAGPDCNGDGIGDWSQITSGQLDDENRNAIPDICEIAVTGVTPVSGPSAGGTILTVKGNNFPENPTVLIGGVPATDVVRVSSTRITATSPAALPGMVSVSVNAWVQPDAFYYRPECGSDLDQDGEVSTADISIVLLDFGPCYQAPVAAPTSSPLPPALPDAPAPASAAPQNR
jgi:hypothetical protein